VIDAIISPDTMDTSAAPWHLNGRTYTAAPSRPDRTAHQRFSGSGTARGQRQRPARQPPHDTKTDQARPPRSPRHRSLTSERRCAQGPQLSRTTVRARETAVAARRADASVPACGAPRASCLHWSVSANTQRSLD
jgi:hypothetical protein